MFAPTLSKLRLARLGFGFILMLTVAGIATAQAVGAIPIPNITLQMGPSGGGTKPGDVSTSLQILALLTVLSLAPAILILTTAFTRIVIIMSLVRTAIGTPTIPPNQVVVGLSLFLSIYVMAPTYQRVWDDAVVPMTAKTITQQQALVRAQVPIREFMLKNTYRKDLKLFLDLRNERPAEPKDVSLVTLIPAFIISELKTAFIVGFYIFLPFLIIDLVVASVLMSLGMMMMPPTVVSLPAKLLVFVLADGWSLLVSAIMAGYR